MTSNILNMTEEKRFVKTNVQNTTKYNWNIRRKIRKAKVHDRRVDIEKSKSYM